MSMLGAAMEMPGDYFRGALTGNLGDRVDPSQFNKKIGMPSNFGTDMLTAMLVDPLTMAGLVGAFGTRAGRRGMKSLTRSGAAKKFLASEEGSLGKQLRTLDDFLQDATKRNEYVTHPGMAELYVRKGPFGFGGKKVDDTIQLARIESDSPGTGQFRKLHDSLAKRGNPIVVEQASPEFGEILQAMGYKPDPLGVMEREGGEIGFETWMYNQGPSRRH